MAGKSLTTASQNYTASPDTRRLRALAQSHLVDIDIENSIEATREAIVARDLEKYSKVRRRDRPNASSSPPPEVKGAKLRSASDVLDRLQHDDKFNIADFRIGYLERFEGIMEMPARSWIHESTDEDWIPQHRIKYIKRIDQSGREEIVWNRETKTDKIFRSGIVATVAESESEFGGAPLT